jgi:hypothetical protein
LGLFAYWLWPFSRLAPNDAISWRGIVPGRTTDFEVNVILGEPDIKEMRDAFLVYIYNDRLEWGGRWR